MKLEKKLNIPADDRVKCSGALQKADEIFIQGRRIHVEIDATGKFVRKSKKLEIDDQQRVLTFRQSNLSAVAQEPPSLDEKPEVSTACGASERGADLRPSSRRQSYPYRLANQFGAAADTKTSQSKFLPYSIMRNLASEGV